MPSLAAWRVVVGLVLTGATIAAAAAQCGVLRMPAPRAAPEATSVAESALAPSRRCFGPGANKAVLTTSDGVRLAAALLGGGPRGLVLIHHGEKDMCQWVRYARRWAAEGYRVVAFDLRCHGLSECTAGDGYPADVAAAVDAARAGGAERVVLVGGALGGTVALVAGARLGQRVAGVVALSAEKLSTVAGGGDGSGTAARIRAPLLMVNTARDAAAMPAAEAEAFLAAVPGRDKQRVVRPGTTHGCEMLNTGGDLPALVDRFLAEHTA